MVIYIFTDSKNYLVVGTCKIFGYRKNYTKYQSRKGAMFMYKNEGCILGLTMDVSGRTYEEVSEMLDKGMVIDVKCNTDGTITISYMLQPIEDDELSMRKRQSFPF